MGVVVAISYKWLPAMIESQPEEALRTSQGHSLALVLLLVLPLVALTQWGLKQLEGRVTVSPNWAARSASLLPSVARFPAGRIHRLHLDRLARRPLFLDQGAGGTHSPLRPRHESTTTVEERLFTSQSERYQEWKAAWETFKEHPLTGTGAATWVVGWLKWRPFDMISKDGHSWFFENLSELGIIGAGLMVAFVAVFLTISIKDLRFLKRASIPRDSTELFSLPSVVLLIHAMIDWDWEMPVIFLTFFMFAGGLLRYGQLSRQLTPKRETAAWRLRPRAGNARTRQGGVRAV